MSNLYKNGFLDINGRNRHRCVCDQHLRFAGVGIAVRDTASRNTRRDLLHVAARASASASLEPHVRFAVPRALLGLIAVLTFVSTAFFLPSPLVVRASDTVIFTTNLSNAGAEGCGGIYAYSCGIVWHSSSTATTTLDYMKVRLGGLAADTDFQLFLYKLPTPRSSFNTTDSGALTSLSAIQTVVSTSSLPFPLYRFDLRPVVLLRDQDYLFLFVPKSYSDPASTFWIGLDSASTSSLSQFTETQRYSTSSDSIHYTNVSTFSFPSQFEIGYSGAEGFALPPIFDTSLGADSALQRNGCYDLSLTDLYGAAKCAVIWAFFPTEEVNDRWLQLRTSLTNAWPLGYAFQVYDARLAASSTSATSSVVIAPTWSSFPTAGAVGHMPAGSIELFSWSKIVTAFSSPFLSYASYLLQVLMWLAFASFLYHFFVVSSTHVHPDKTS